MRRHKPPTLVSMWMLDVFCCALGCVTLLWLLKTREAGQISNEASQVTALLNETRGDLTSTRNTLVNVEKTLKDSEERSALRLADATRLAAELDKLNQQLALMKQQREADAKHLALVEKELQETKNALVRANNTTRDLEKNISTMQVQSSSTMAELQKKQDELSKLNRDLAMTRKEKLELDELVRTKEKMRTDAERKAQTSQAELDAMAKSMPNVDALTKQLKDLQQLMGDQQKKNEQASLTIIDLQGQKAKLADKVNQLQIDQDARFAGIAMTGKRVVFMVDMSGSMDRVQENTLDPAKWPLVAETVKKVMRSLPDLEKFQLVLFSSATRYPLGGTGWIDFDREKSPEAVRQAMVQIRPMGDTNIYKAMEDVFRFREAGMDTIYLFSDGLPTSGAGLTPEQMQTLNEVQRSDLLSRHARQTLQSTWNAAAPGKEKVRINTIGFFYESPDVGAFLWALARENNGSFVGMSKP
ncbi:MAG: VWA domain-containing protein [Zavarzinella sp.]